jgi:hypothetical protein
LEKLLETVAYETPEVLGSFAAHDILGAVDGMIAGGSSISG